jgi:hypothetical protein
MFGFMDTLLTALLGDDEEPPAKQERGRIVIAEEAEPSASAMVVPSVCAAAPSRPGASAEPPQHTPAPTPAPGMVGSPDFSAAVKRIFSERDPTQVGSIHLLGLESLREKLGDRWEGVRERVSQLAEKLLALHMQPGDAWFRHSTDAYVVVFAKLGPAQAQLVCAKIVEELQRLLLGNADTASITVRTIVREAGSDVVFVPTRLADMLNQAAERSAQAAPARVGAEAGMTTAPPQRRMATLEPMEVMYRPVWDVRQQVLSVFIARARRQRQGRSALWGYDCIEDQSDPAQILDHDQNVLTSSLDTAMELYDNRFRFFLSVPVHIESLAVIARRRAIVGCLQQIPQHMREFMTYHIVGASDGIPPGRLSELAAALKPFGRTVMMVVDPAVNDLSSLEASGIKVAMALLPQGASSDRWRADLLKFGANAAKRQIRSYVEGVNDISMEDLCEEAEISFLAGDLIGDWVEVPEHVVRMSRTDFLRHKTMLPGKGRGAA